MNIPRFLQLYAEDRLEDAFLSVILDNPLPSSTGRVCQHPCDSRCRRQTIDETVNMLEVHRFIADSIFHSDRYEKMVERILAKRLEHTGRKIAIAGAGPAGLTAAFYLAMLGHDVTLYDAKAEAGGMLRFALPEFRLPKSVLAREIDLIKRLGVNFVFNTRIGFDIPLNERIKLRKFGLQLIEGLAQERVHASWVVPGGVASPLSPPARDRILADLPAAKSIAERTLRFFKNALGNYKEEIAYFGSAPTMYAGLVDPEGNLQFYDGELRFSQADGQIAAENIAGEQYADWMGEASLRHSYLKAPYYKPKGFPDGVYRVGPLARINVADQCGTPLADVELKDFRQRFGHPAHSAFLYHYARLLEIIHAFEKIEMLLADPQIHDKQVRATGGVNSLEGVGMIEAPRGILIHHYKLNEDDAITWANLIVATGHNNLAIGRSVQQVSEHFIDGNKLQEGMLNRVSAVVRAYDPCLSCSTHAIGEAALRIRLVNPAGELLDEISRS